MTCSPGPYSLCDPSALKRSISLTPRLHLRQCEGDPQDLFQGEYVLAQGPFVLVPGHLDLEVVEPEAIDDDRLPAGDGCVITVEDQVLALPPGDPPPGQCVIMIAQAASEWNGVF